MNDKHIGPSLKGLSPSNSKMIDHTLPVGSIIRISGIPFRLLQDVMVTTATPGKLHRFNDGTLEMMPPEQIQKKV